MSGPMLVHLSADDLAQLVRRAVRDELVARVDDGVFITRAEAAKLMKCSEKTVLTRIKEGLPAEKLGAEWRFERAKVLDFMRTRRKAG